MTKTRFVTIWTAFLFCGVAAAKTDEWSWSRRGEVTRCYETSSLHARCEDYSDNRKLKVQELLIEAVDVYGVRHFYGYGKAIEGTLCRQHLRTIKKLLHQTDQVCVTASDEFPTLGKGAFYRWKALETKRGKLIW